MSEVIDQKKQKKVIGEGTDLFNKKPKKGINYLCEHGIFKTPMDPHEVAMFLRENPHLDKAMIGECIGSRDNSEILSCFVESFPFENTRLDVALRMFVEAFRLPGEAQIIDKILDKFSGKNKKGVISLPLQLSNWHGVILSRSGSGSYFTFTIFRPLVQEQQQFCPC